MLADELGSTLKRCRHSRRISLVKLAAAVDYSESAVKGWENGKCIPSARALYRVARALGVTMDGLMEGTAE